MPNGLLVTHALAVSTGEQATTSGNNPHIPWPGTQSTEASGERSFVVPDEWLTPEEVADALGCPAERVNATIQDKLRSGEDIQLHWQIKASEVERLRAWIHADRTEPSARTAARNKVEAGMVEASMALTGIASALAAVLPGMKGTSESVWVAFWAGILAVLSAYSALWLLALWWLAPDEHEKTSPLGFKEIGSLLWSLGDAGPYWFVALGLIVWLVGSAVIGISAVME